MSQGQLDYLALYLNPFLTHLRRIDVTDIYVNRPGEIWVETLGGGIEQYAVPEIDEASLMRLARQIASMTHQGISREHPLLAATLPDGARIQVVAPPATRGDLALAIRKHVSRDLCLGDYETQGAFESTLPGHRDGDEQQELSELYQRGQWPAFLRAAVRARKTIVVAGGTSTGKTTFVNALMREIPDNERLVLIEDTPELALRHVNAVGLVGVRGRLGEAAVDADDLLMASLRMRPDRIILGELRGAEAFTFLRAVNTGHPGSITTVHADSPGRAVEQIAMLVLQSGTQLRHADVIAYLEGVVDIFVQLERRDGRRRVATGRLEAFCDAVTHGM